MNFLNKPDHKPLFDVPVVNNDDHVPTDDELLGEDEEIMREAYLKSHPEEINKTTIGSKVEFPKDELNS